VSVTSERWIAAVIVVVLTAVSWAWIAPMARDMYGPMTGLSSWMMAPSPTPAYVLLLWAMWAVMMAAMMLPSAMPLVVLYGGIRRRQASAAPHAAVAALVVGYLLVWSAFSIAATALQLLLSRWLLLNPMMEMASGRAIGAMLLVAGAYQLTRWKGMCLTRCRSPLSFLMQRWRGGTTGALRMGAEHGVHCVGCCWALMLLLFAGGVMNLIVIVGLTVVVLIEKLTPIGVQAGRVVGTVLIAAGLWWLVR
jgi:predicted metal-binding membrane protein